MKPSAVIVGLGNIGKEYETTRHNVGFMAVDRLAEEWGEGEWKDQPKWSCSTCEARVSTFPILLVKPHTYMNRSGETISKIFDFYKLDSTTQLLVIVDDLDLNLGTVRYRKQGSAGTHNGLKSVIAAVGQEFHRYRIGIGPKDERYELSAWVLSRFSEADMQALQPIFEELPARIKSAMFQ